MASNRRHWLRQLGLGLTGMGLASFRTLAAAEQDDIGELPSPTDPIILRSNENPYGPSPMAKAALARYAQASNRYGWDLTIQLMERLAKQHQLQFDHVLLGAGSTELLDLVARYAVTGQSSFVLAEPTYFFWAAPLEQNGAKKIAVPLREDKSLDLDAMRSAIRPDTRLVYICNPNNPTGTLCSRESLMKFIIQVPATVTVLVDEAYLDYTTESSLCSLVTEIENLVVTKTFSKIHGLAGARIGYALAHPKIIEKLSAMQSWPNGSVGVAAAAAALASLDDASFLSQTFSRNQSVRHYTLNQLQELNLACIPSTANFIYFSLEQYKGDYFRKLESKQIQGTRIYEERGQWTRITVGTQAEMEQFVKAIR